MTGACLSDFDHPTCHGHPEKLDPWQAKLFSWEVLKIDRVQGVRTAFLGKVGLALSGAGFKVEQQKLSAEVFVFPRPIGMRFLSDEAQTKTNGDLENLQEYFAIKF